MKTRRILWGQLFIKKVKTPEDSTEPIFTIVRLHMLAAEGVDNFAERNDYRDDLLSRIVYLIFSTDDPFAQYSNGRKILSKAAQAEKAKRDSIMKEIEDNRKKRDAQYNSNKGSLTKPNVAILPVISFNNKIKYFGAYDGVRANYNNNGIKSIDQVARLTKLEVNGTSYLKYPVNNLSSPVGLYLKPGVYDINITFELKIAPPLFGSNFTCYTTKINKKISLNVTSSTENIYLALLCKLDF